MKKFLKLTPFREKRFQKIVAVHGKMIQSATDLTGGKVPSWLCLIFGGKYRELFNEAEDEAVYKKIAWRQCIHPLMKKMFPLFMSQKQVLENRKALRLGILTKEPDPGIVLPKEPVIWMGNHGFHDDAAATLNVVYRHTYMFFASLPQFYNTFDGIAAYLNGVVMMNRKVRESRESAVRHVIQVMRQGTDMLIYPEGVWNKSPNLLLLPLWPGIYRICQETGAQIVPVIHYICEPARKLKGNDIHTVVDDPVSLEGMSERAALDHLRDIMATWYWLLMERYGRTTRDNLLMGVDACSAWERSLEELLGTADYYDREIELVADYRPRDVVRPEQVWEAVANIRNITASNVDFVVYAREQLKQVRQEDFQRRF